MSMNGELRVVAVDRVNEMEILVEFSDETSGIFTPAQLAAIMPERPKAETRLPRQGE